MRQNPPPRLYLFPVGRDFVLALRGQLTRQLTEQLRGLAHSTPTPQARPRSPRIGET